MAVTIRTIHNTHREAIQEYYTEGFSISELVIMYRNELHERELKAISQVKKIVKGLERPERI